MFKLFLDFTGKPSRKSRNPLANSIPLGAAGHSCHRACPSLHPSLPRTHQAEGSPLTKSGMKVSSTDFLLQFKLQSALSTVSKAKAGENTTASKWQPLQSAKMMHGVSSTEPGKHYEIFHNHNKSWLKTGDRVNPPLDRVNPPLDRVNPPLRIFDFSYLGFGVSKCHLNIWNPLLGNAKFHMKISLLKVPMS